MLVTIWHPTPTIECPPGVNNSWRGSVSYTAINCVTLWLNWVLHGQSFQYVLVFNLTNMHAMSHRPYFFAWSCRVNIWEPAVGFTVSLPLAVFQVWLTRFPIPTAMSDSKSLNTSFLEVMISSKDERLCICGFSVCTVQIIFDAWWSWMNVGSKRPIGWNNSRHAPSWWFYLQCTIEETGNPGIICIVSHQVLLHLSEHGTSLTGNHLLPIAHIAKLKEVTESEVTELTSWTVDETALPILKRQGDRGLTLLSYQRKIIFDIQVDPYWPK